MLRRLIIVLLFCFPMVSAAVVAQSVYVVTAKTLNVRSAPNTHASVVGKLHQGDTISEIIDKGGYF